MTVPPGGFLYLYTDGLVERRPGPGRAFTSILDDNTARVAEALLDPQDPEVCCLRALAEIVGDRVTEDDVAILVAHVHGAIHA